MKFLHKGNITPDKFNEMHYTKKEHIEYNINYNEEIILSSNYVGIKSKIPHNALGWEKNNTKYFKELMKKFPLCFSEDNKMRINNNKAPKVDETFVKYFNEYKYCMKDVLMVHHIGRDGQVVTLPKRLHNGFGEVHNVEKQIGLVKNATDFTNKVESGINDGKFDYGKDVLYYYDDIE